MSKNNNILTFSITNQDGDVILPETNVYFNNRYSREVNTFEKEMENVEITIESSSGEKYDITKNNKKNNSQSKNNNLYKKGDLSNRIKFDIEDNKKEEKQVNQNNNQQKNHIEKEIVKKQNPLTKPKIENKTDLPGPIKEMIKISTGRDVPTPSGVVINNNTDYEQMAKDLGFGDDYETSEKFRKNNQGGDF